MMNITKQIPNLITLLNLALGFSAILLNDALLSPMLILAAGLADLLDGLTARWLKAYSGIGGQLDSLADMVSFGVAPAYLYFHHVMGDSLPYLFLVAVIPVATAIRLAVYNLDDSQKSDFLGLASPSSGLFFAFLVFGWKDYPDLLRQQWLVVSLPLIFAFLMLSRWRMFSLKGLIKGSRLERILIILLALSALVLFIWVQWKGIPLVVLVYLLLSVFYALFRVKKVT